MPWEAWLTWATVVGVLGVTATGRVTPDVAFGGALVGLLLAGVFGDDAASGLAGFSNPGVLTVGALLVVAAALRETGALDRVTQPILGSPSSVFAARVRLTVPVAAASAFLNNTPVVAVLVPAVTDWCRRLSIPPSKLLLPLSYGAIFGGVCTLIGTSTNLVVYGWVLDFAPDLEIGFFDITWIGLPCAIVGLVYVSLAGGRLLPSRKSFEEQVEDSRNYAVEMVVMDDSPIAGSTIEEAGLRRLPGLFLAEIDREGDVLAAVPPTERLRAGDHLVFVGLVESIADLQRIRGLVPAPDQVFKLGAPRSDRQIVEVVVSGEAPFAGTTVREAKFRTQYNAAIIAVSRGGERLRQKIGDIVLQAGDTLLLEAHPEFASSHRSSRAFFVVGPAEGSGARRHDRALRALAVLVALVVSMGFGWLDPVVAALGAAGAMIATGCLPLESARRAIDLSLLVVIAAALGLGRALHVSGGAEALAGALVLWLGESPPWIALLAVYLTANALTEVVNNNAAAVVVLPVAAEVASALDVSFTPFAMAIMVAASASFATPIGYQTNLLVYGPGGYRFGDYARFGLPLNAAFAVTVVAITPWAFPF